MKQPLPAYSFETIQQQHNDSAQAQAWNWLLNDPNLEGYINLEWRVVQRFALATFFYATQGLEWTNNTGWLSYELHECSWFGRHYLFPPYAALTPFEVEYPNPCGQANVTTTPSDSIGEDGMETRYKHLLLYDNNLYGHFPEEIFLISSLRSLSCAKNQLVGTISTSIAAMQNLEVVILSINSMTGTLPSEIGLLSDLSLLEMAENALHGMVPTELGSLTSLQTLLLDSNNFTDIIPIELFSATSLRLLHLYDNDFVPGTLPTEIGKLRALGDLYLDSCNLTGTVSWSHLGKLGVTLYG